MGGIKSSKYFTIQDRNYAFLKMNNTQATAIGMDPDAAAYIARVEADGGTVVNPTLVDLAIKQAKADGWYSDCKFWFAGFGGYKIEGSGVSVWYNMGTVTIDALQTNNTYRPSFASSIAVQNNMPGLGFDSTGQDNGRHLTLTAMSSLFPSEGTLFTSHWADSDDLYSIFGTTSNDQWWRVGGGGQYPGVWRSSRINNLGSPSVFSGNQYTTITSNSSSWTQRQNGVANISTGGDYNAGGTYYISDTTGRNDRSVRGYITEVIGLSVTASAGVISTIEGNLVSRYAL